jgi:hypothetical protein
VFGCKAFAHIPKDERRKLDAKSIKCIFIGYCSDKKAYKLFDPDSHKLFATRDVVFHENANRSVTMNDVDVGIFLMIMMILSKQMQWLNRNMNMYRFKNGMKEE